LVGAIFHKTASGWRIRSKDAALSSMKLLEPECCADQDTVLSLFKSKSIPSLPVEVESTVRFRQSSAYSVGSQAPERSARSGQTSAPGISDEKHTQTARDVGLEACPFDEVHPVICV